MTEQDGFRMLVEGLPVPVARLAPDLRIVYVNEALCGRFAKSREALIGRSALTLVPESDRESLAQHLASLDAEHPVGRFESSGAPSGEEPGGLRWIIRAVHDDEENLLEYQALVHDQGGARNDTDHENADGPLARIEEGFRSVVHNSSEIVKIVDLDGTLRYASPAFGRILGYDPELAIGTNVLEYVHPEDLPRVLEETERASNEAGTASSKAEYRFKHEDGSWRWLESVGTYLLDDPSVGAVVLNARDVTERKEAEEGLRKAEQLYRTLVEQIPAVTYVDRADGTDEPVYTSPRIEEMLGYTPEEWISGRLWSECLHPDDRERVLTADERFEAGDGPFSEEYRLIAKDGSVVWVREDAELVSDEEERPLYWQGVMLNITESKDAEEAVRESERRFRSLIRNASDIIMVVGEDGRVRYISPAIERVLGYRPDWVEDRDAFEIVHPEDLDHVSGSLGRLADESQEAITMEVRLRHTDGSWRHMESVATNLLDDPAVRGVVVNSRDITERKKFRRSVAWS